MSTISDALKKAQEQRSAGRVGQWPAEGGASRMIGKQAVPKDRSQLKAALISIFATVFVFSVALMIVFRPAGLQFRKSSPAAQVSAVAAKVPPAPDPATPPAAAPPVVLPQPTAQAPKIQPPAVLSGPVVAETKPVDAASVPREPAPRPPPANVPTLSGIFYSEQNPIAIINGASLKEGETIGVWQVVKIRLESVTVRADEQDVEIRMK